MMYDKVESFVQINSIQCVHAFIQNFGSAALNLIYSNYDPACGTVKRKAVNKFISHESIFNLKYEITTLLVLKQYDCLIYDYTFEVLSSMFALLKKIKSLIKKLFPTFNNAIFM